MMPLLRKIKEQRVRVEDYEYLYLVFIVGHGGRYPSLFFLSEKNKITLSLDQKIPSNNEYSKWLVSKYYSLGSV